MSDVTPARRLLGVEDAAQYINDQFGLDVTDRWLTRQMRERRIAYYKIGGMVRFATTDLDQILDNAYVPATQPLNRLTPDGAEEDNGGDDNEEVLTDEEEEEPEPEPEPAPAPKPKPAATRRRTIAKKRPATR